MAWKHRFCPFITERPPGDMKDSKMQAYVCIYRHPLPNWHHRTQLAAASNDTLRKFLNVYKDSNYDSGDDPSFFAARTLLGDEHKATWGVCRPGLRNRLNTGDYVVFFCAKQMSTLVWEYFYIGVGTIAGSLDRKDIWLDDRYASYRNFLNILASYSNGKPEHYEPIYPYHPEWLELWETTPYLEFDRGKSQFNLDNPLHVATYTGTQGPFETWRSSQDQQVKRLETLLFPQSASRRLRKNIPPTVPKRFRRPHTQINLQRQLGRHTDLNTLRLRLIEFASDSQ
jgi:hypothetical protein